MKIDKKSEVLLWAMLLIMIASIAATYYRTMVQRDFIVTSDPVAQ